MGRSFCFCFESRSFETGSLGSLFWGGHFESMLVFHISLVALSLSCWFLGFLDVVVTCISLCVVFFLTPFDISVTSVLRTGLDVFFSPCVNRYKKNYNNQDSFFDHL